MTAELGTGVADYSRVTLTCDTEEAVDTPN
jgi:hypothetical protein